MTLHTFPPSEAVILCLVHPSSNVEDTQALHEYMLPSSSLACYSELHMGEKCTATVMCQDRFGICVLYRWCYVNEYIHIYGEGILAC